MPPTPESPCDCPKTSASESANSGALVAHGRIALRRLRPPAVERQRQPRRDLRRHGDGRHDDAHEQVAERLALERQLAGQRLEHDDAERPKIAAVVDRLDALRLLGAHVIGRSEHRPGLGVAALDGRLLVPWRCRSRGPWRSRDRRPDEEDVVGLEVAVDDPDAVRLGERAADLRRRSRRRPRATCCPSLVQALAEVLAVEELHRDVRRALRRRRDRESARRAGCAAAAAAFASRSKRACASGSGAYSPSMNFTAQGMSSAEVRGVPDRAHAASPKLAIEPEALRDDHVGCELHRVPGIGGRESDGERVRVAPGPAAKGYAIYTDSHLRLGPTSPAREGQSAWSAGPTCSHMLPFVARQLGSSPDSSGRPREPTRRPGSPPPCARARAAPAAHALPARPASRAREGGSRHRTPGGPPR